MQGEKGSLAIGHGRGGHVGKKVEVDEEAKEGL